MAKETKKEENQVTDQNKETSLDKMTVKELKEIAKEIPEITGLSSMKKDELIAAIKKVREKEESKEEKPAPEKMTTEIPLDKMTIKELKEIAREIPGVEGVTAMKKDELLVLIKEERGIKEEKPAEKEKVKAGEAGLSVKEMKQQIFLLRGQKKAAREARDRHRVDILRRRINRLKKRTRKVAQQA